MSRSALNIDVKDVEDNAVQCWLNVDIRPGESVPRRPDYDENKV